MAVPEGKRAKSKLEVQTRAKELALYTVTICSNEKTFPKRDRWVLTNRIVSTAIAIMEEVDTANSIFVTDASDYTLRRQSQTLALAYTAKLLGLVELAYLKYHIDSKRIEHWTRLIVNVRDLIKGWRNTDKSRYKNYGQ
jgi:hypothetical protein